MSKKILIVGGVAGGASAAARLRRLDENAQIIMFEKNEYISFANCGLPYYVSETINEREKLIVQTPEGMKERFNIDVRNNSEVIGVDINKKLIKVKSKDKNIYSEDFDYLILSPGAKPIKPDIKGINLSKILTLRNIPDIDRVKSYVDDKKVKNAVIIGGGYIGIEMAENLRSKGISVTVAEAAPHILSPFDNDMVTAVEKELVDNGVKLIFNDGVKAFEDISDHVEITLNSSKKLSADMVILSIGIIPDTQFLYNSGIKLSAKGHIIVNDKMETNIKGIYAVGDAIEVTDYINHHNTAVPLAGPANKQGRIAADNIEGLNKSYKGTQGTSIIKVFGLTAAITGNNEKTLKKMNIPYKVIYIHPYSHASYYPDALPLSLKLIFNNEGMILGAQSVGYEGVDKRIDIIASIIRLNGTVSDLSELELCYAPPYSSAKDPVNMAGFVAENVLSGKMDIVTPEEFMNSSHKNSIVLDVRTQIEFDTGHIEGAINIPVNILRENIGKLDNHKEVIIYCEVGLRGYIASRILAQNGFKCKNITGGYKSIAMLNYKPQDISLPFDKINTANNTEYKEDEYDKIIDACGLSCPGPLMQVKNSIDNMNDGMILKVTASDPGFYEDIKSWCRNTNNKLIDLRRENGKISAFIKKEVNAFQNPKQINVSDVSSKDNKTIIVFSGDLDKAIASFIIANGAASMGKKVTMFFTFWGLNILRKPEKVNVKKSLIDKMFGFMMPRGSKKLQLSKMNMMGIGGKMIRSVMKNKNITSLEELIQSAINNGIQIIACQMSMDVMGLKKEELIDGIKIGGVGYYLGEAEDSNVNLFI